jgi:predicted ATPase
MSLALQEVSASGYRSLRRIRFPIGRLSVFVGANGVGKTNLYRALQLLQAAASNTLSREIAADGGINAVMWAGKWKAKEIDRIVLTVGFGAGDQPTHDYTVEVGRRIKIASAAFDLEPQVKEERVVFHHGERPVILLDRRGPSVTALDAAAQRLPIARDLMASETALGSLEDPSQFPDLHLVRRTMLDWRFYHDLRTDAAAPMRQPSLPVATPTLASDGADLAAVFATLAHIRQDTVDLDRAIDDAFPGARLIVPPPEKTASFGVTFPEFPHRIFTATELSDGTLRYLGLMGALLAYRLPAFVALNEPEASLHPDLLDPLARLIVRAAERTQIWLVTHSIRLADAIAAHGGIAPRTVIKRNGETWIEGLTMAGEFAEDEEA